MKIPNSLNFPCLRTCRQWIAIITVTMTALSCGLVFSWPTAALPQIESGKAGFSLDLSQQSWVVSIVFLGNMISPIPSGYLVDWVGRRTSLALVIWLQVIAWGLISLGIYWLLILCRIVSGIWVGLVYTAAPMYLGESIEPGLRGTAFAFFSIFLFSGSLAQSLLGGMMSYMTLALACCGFNIFLAVALILVPESPYYYVLRGKEKEAETILVLLRGSCPPDLIPSIRQSICFKKTTFKKFFSRNNRKSLFVVLSLLIVQRTAGITILFSFTSVTLPDSFISASTSTIVLSITWVLVAAVISPFMDRFGRKTLMAASCAGGFLSILSLAIWFFLRDYSSVNLSRLLWLPLMCCIIHGVFYSFGIVTIPAILQGEMFPMNIKATASALGAITAALFSGIVTNIYLPIMHSIGAYFNFAISSCGCLVGLFIALFVMVETKGKSLEEIQDLLTKKYTSDKT